MLWTFCSTQIYSPSWTCRESLLYVNWYSTKSVTVLLHMIPNINVWNVVLTIKRICIFVMISKEMKLQSTDVICFTMKNIIVPSQQQLMTQMMTRMMTWMMTWMMTTTNTIQLIHNYLIHIVFVSVCSRKYMVFVSLRIRHSYSFR